MQRKKQHKPLFEGNKLPVNRFKVVFNSTFFEIPESYVDKPFKCKLCSKKEVWTAKQQKWWYEEVKGDLETTAVICRECRDKKKAQKDLLKSNNKGQP